MYGEDIPVACVGIITNVNQMFFSFVIGLSQGLQPIASYNYGGGMFLSLTRQIFCLLPSFYLLSLIGLNYTWLAFPLSETVAGLIGLICCLNTIKKWKLKQNITKECK